MWKVNDLRTVPRTYSFESSEQGQHRDEALVADGVTLVNMMQRVEWTDDPMQVEVCTSCGFAHCASGNYVALRRIPGFVVLVASLRAYDDTVDKFDEAEYVAPAFMRQKGAPMITLSAWNRLRADHADLPDADAVRPLRWSEALLLAQFEAPRRLLGEPGSRVADLLSKSIIASSPFLATEDLDRLGDIRSWRTTHDAEVKVLPASETRTYSLTIDNSFEEVILFGEVAGVFGVYFKPGLVFFPAAEQAGARDAVP
jgi:hypothetical protein